MNVSSITLVCHFSYWHFSDVKLRRLLGIQQKSRFEAVTAAFDPKRTLTTPNSIRARRRSAGRGSP